MRIWQMLRNRQIDWQVVLLIAPVGLELIRQALGFRWSGHHRLFYLQPDPFWTLAVILLATVLAVATPIKIWNNARIEHRLEEQEKLLLAARIEALSNRINPHFLFNTLTSISSLIRTQPDTARMLITKLSGLLRRLMRSTDHFVTPSRGTRIDRSVPGHRGRCASDRSCGSSRRSPRRRSTRSCRACCCSRSSRTPSSTGSPARSEAAGSRSGPIRRGDRSLIEVEDDGLGMTEERLKEALEGGIGLSNVNERLRTIYGAACTLKLSSVTGRGTSVSVEIPDLTLPERIPA